MKTPIFAFALAAILSGPALAQQAAPADPNHQAHHPQVSQQQATSPAGTQAPAANAPAQGQQMMPGMQGGMPGMQGGMMGRGGQGPGGMMSGMGMGQGMGQGMMNCPMMQGGMMRGGMAGMMRPGTGGMQMGMPSGDQSVGSLALGAINQRMHREMMMDYTGNVDADFARSMIAHHQGAIDMAKVVAAFGKDPKIRELAQNIIKAQEDEITTMQSWLAQNARQ